MNAKPPLPELPGYEILREIGAGGMSNVYLARQTSLGRLVAIKVMRRSGDEAEKLEKRFLLEGRTMAQLPHRNIAGIYDIVQRPEVAYIAMEFLEGGTLSERMRIGLSLSEAVSITVQLAQALQYAHDHGVVHRDLKPANVMFRDTQTPVLTDFGIARQQDASATRLTQAGMLVGTPTYMSPEQINGNEVDGRSDLYSLGVLFYELLTGAPPFKGDTPISVLMAHMTQPPPPLPETFSGFQPIIDRCLAKERDDRYASVSEFMRALKAVVVNSQTLMARLYADPNMSSSEQLRALGFSISHPAVSGERTPPAAQRTDSPASTRARPGWLRAAIVGAVAVVLLSVVAYFVVNREPALDPAVQAVVDQALRRADDHIAAGQLVEPAEDNALAVLDTARQAAPNYAPIDRRVDRIAELLLERAGAAIDGGDLDRAAILIGQGEAVRPQHPALSGLRQSLAAARNAAALEARYVGLVEAAEAASRDGRDLTGGNDDAVSLLRQARTLMPDDPRALAALDRVAARVLAPVADLLAADDLAGARARLAAAAEDLGETASHRHYADELELRLDAEARRSRVAQLLDDTRRLMAAGALWQPPDANASDSLDALLGLDPGNAQALAAQAELGTLLGRAAEASLQEGRTERAHAEISRALRARPDDRSLLALRSRVDRALGEQRARVLQSLEDARMAIAEGRIVSPEFESARFYLRSVLVQDPGNDEAQSLLEALPGQLAEQGAQALAEGRVERAQALAADARRAYPELVAQMPFIATLATAVRDRESLDAIASRVDEVYALLAERPLRAASLERAAREIRAIGALEQGEQMAQQLRRRLLETLREPLSNAPDAIALDAAADALRAVSRQMPGDALLADLITRYEVRRRELLDAEARQGSG